MLLRSPSLIVKIDINELLGQTEEEGSDPVPRKRARATEPVELLLDLLREAKLPKREESACNHAEALNGCLPFTP